MIGGAFGKICRRRSPTWSCRSSTRWCPRATGANGRFRRSTSGWATSWERVVDFLIVAFVIFLVHGQASAARAPPEVPPATKDVPGMPGNGSGGRAPLPRLHQRADRLATDDAGRRPLPPGNLTFTYGKLEKLRRARRPPRPWTRWNGRQDKRPELRHAGNSQTTNGHARARVSRKERRKQVRARRRRPRTASRTCIVPQIVTFRTQHPTMTIMLPTARSPSTSPPPTTGEPGPRPSSSPPTTQPTRPTSGGVPVAGKSSRAGGQVGYSRQLIKNDTHTLVSEIDDDLARQHDEAQPGRTLDPVSIHSARRSWARR